jgi:hypothetical protein
MTAPTNLRHLVEGPEDCPICEGPCSHEMERGDYVLGGPREAHPHHPDHEEWLAKQRKPAPKKRPHGKRRPAEDRARHLSEDR